MDSKKANPKKEVAGSFYHPSYYQEKDDLSSGLATTHEQVSDVYMEGDISAAVFDNGGDSSEGQDQE